MIKTCQRAACGKSYEVRGSPSDIARKRYCCKTCASKAAQETRYGTNYREGYRETRRMRGLARLIARES